MFRTSIMVNAAAAVVVHNHPSGDPKPSENDIELTRRLVRISKDLGLFFWDHIIIASEDCYSFLDQGLMERIVGEESKKYSSLHFN